ncbi:MAG: oligosaccharide flippase family protein [Bacteroidales bacterium]|nr:oligosaccharide flippase family protein [Bacteroidales bacterium]
MLTKISSFTKQSESFSGNVMKLMTGTVLAQALGLLAMPVATRLFAPEAFGIVTIFSSMAGIVGVVICLRYEIAIILPESAEEAANILGVSLLSVIMMTFVSILIVWLGSEQIISLLNAPQLKNYLWLIPMTIFFQGLFLALNYWNSRTKHFGRISVAQVVSSLVVQTTKLLAGFAGFVSGGVLIGTAVLGSIISTGMLGGQIWRDDKKLFFNSIRWKQVGKGFVRYKKFALIDTWGGLLNAISWQLPALMLSSFFSISVVGFYALGLAVIKTPLSIMSGALSQVFYQKASNEKTIKGNNGKLVENLMDKLMFFGILPTAVLSMVGEELFTVVFGARWFEAGQYTQILAPWIFFWFISSPLSALFSVYERQGSALFVHLLIFLTRVISLYIGGVYQNIYLALALFSGTGIIAYALVAAWNIRLARSNGRNILFTFFKYSLHSLPILLCLFLVKYIFQFKSIVILSSAVTMALLYFFAYRKKIQSIVRSEGLCEKF